MTMTDPVADMLTRIRNANTVCHPTVDIPASKMKKSIAEILLDEGYISGFEVIEDGKQGIIRVEMKYGADKERVIKGIKKISKPGLKVYAKADNVPKVLGGLGIAIISTSKGNQRQGSKKTRCWRRSNLLCLVGGRKCQE